MKQLAAIAFLGLWSWSAQAQPCVINNPGTEPLLANGSTPAGNVIVSNDQTNLYVTVATTGDFTISRLDVAVATTLAGIPQSGGQPNLSQFPYRKTFSPEVTSFMFTIPLGTITFGTTVFVAAHASLDSPTQGHQQAWAAGTLFPCSQACTSGSGCKGGDRSHLNNGDGGGGGDDDCGCEGGDRSHLNDGNGGGGDCHHGDGQSGLAQHGIGIFDDGHGGQQQCGGGAGDHGDHQGSSPLWDNGGGGDNSCGGGDDDHGGDHANRRGASHLNDGGGDGGGDHSGGGSDCTAGCGATYFTYMVNCAGQIE
ncbi:MAG TPA: hypothetical protein VHB47_07760 [Thermoanaerobaculia bacterium]|jgi:hypothetical protein|nr:hypothetical protein [Thermoanaerobaculia bacterium]